MATCLFPRSQPTANNPQHGGVVQVQLPSQHDLLRFCKEHHLTVEQTMHVVWALLLRRYVGSDCVAFAILSADTAAGSTWFSCQMEEVKPFMTYLEDIKICYHSLWPTSTEGDVAFVVNTGVIFKGMDEKGQQNVAAVGGLPPQNNFVFLVDADFRNTSPRLSLIHNSEVDARVARNVASTLARAVSEIISLNPHASTSVNELDLLSERDAEQLRDWNGHYPQALHSCIHDMISEQAQATPDAEAICSWDGSLTYRQMEDLSTLLAAHIQRKYPHHTGPEIAVGICFEKSLAAVVAELAVLKTGSVLVPLDGGHPTDRLKAIVEIAEVSLVLASPQWTSRMEGLVIDVLCVPTSAGLLRDMCSPTEPSPPATPTSGVTPDNAAFMLFTSGSTGKPKAVVQQHGAICTLFKSHAKSLHVDSSCRVLQFAAYTFDVSTMDIYTTLMQGGCLCVPSEDDRRNDLAGFIRRAKVNWADLTATVANLLYPDQVPTLKTLVLAGEAVQEVHLQRWFGHVRLINCYGPVESGNCTAYEFNDRHSKPAATIGYTIDGARCWIVNPQNPHRLASVGEVGEILVEGPTLSRGYLKDTIRTQSAFLKDLNWCKHGRFAYPNYDGQWRFYRTADMAFLDPDGLFVFVGRSDQQVKVHGQRVELMEIEHHLIISFSSVIARAVVAYPRSGPLTERLIGVLQLNRAAAKGPAAKKRAVGRFHLFDFPKADLILRSKLPGYMVPSLLLVIDRMPVTGSGKSDRKRIQEMLCSLPGEAKFSSLEAPDLSPLALDETVASAISSFLSDLFELDMIRNRDVQLDRLGISSIQAMTLLTWLKSRYGVNLSIESLNKDGVTVRCLAKAVQAAVTGTRVLDVDLEEEVRHITRSISRGNDQKQRSNDHESPRPHDSPKTVFLTGATGYLGIEIFHQLLSLTTVRCVHVLVQTTSHRDGVERLRHALRGAGNSWNSAWEGRVIVWLGDLSQPRLGLKAKHWEQLNSGEIDTIIHNGASVRYNQGYEKLKPVNVLSTADVLHAIRDCPRAINFVYVSGGQRLSPEQEASEAVRIKEAARSTGYSQSKLVSELIVSRMADDFAKIGGHKLRVVRPGYIIGSPKKGVANTRDYIWRLVAGAVEAGIVSRGHDNEWIFVCEVEQVAQRILSSGGVISPTMCDGQGDLAKVTTITDGLYLSQMWELVRQELQCILRPVHSPQWWSSLRHFVEQQGDSHPLWPLFFLLNQEQGAFTCVWTSDTTAASRQLVMEAIRENISYLRQAGFLTGPGLDPVREDRKVSQQCVR